MIISEILRSSPDGWKSTESLNRESVDLLCPSLTCRNRKRTDASTFSVVTSSGCVIAGYIAKEGDSWPKLPGTCIVNKLGLRRSAYMRHSVSLQSNYHSLRTLDA